jgi:hypothetical protein
MAATSDGLEQFDGTGPSHQILWRLTTVSGNPRRFNHQIQESNLQLSDSLPEGEADCRQLLLDRLTADIRGLAPRQQPSTERCCKR